MDKNNNQNDQWLDDLLGKSPVSENIGADPSADLTSNLIPPKDLQLEKIMKEYRDPSAPAEEAFPAEPEIQLDLFDEPKPEPPKPAPRKKGAPSPVAKAPEKKKRRFKDRFGVGGLLATLIWLALILVIGVTLGRNLWVYTADVMAFGKKSQNISITITEEDDLDAVIEKLSNAELIRYPKLFRLFATLTHKDELISAGTYELNAYLDYNAMINAMANRGTSRKEVEIMFPEGYSCAQIFASLEQHNVCKVEDLERYAETGELSDYWFLEGVSRDGKYCLEGYLFPDTYKFYENDEPRRVLEKFLDNFGVRFTDVMKEEFEVMKGRYARMLSSHGYSEDYIASNGLTIRKVVIIASLIEKETASVNESYDISSVIYNRLTNQAAYPFLNIDAALVYALDGKDNLTEEDKTFDSPYNTYKYPGLIPGPIANPGRDSLYAALDPNETSYYFYALNPSTNRHHFSKTYNEHTNFLTSIG